MAVRIADAWNGWYHLNGNTYGTWIRGDERGWRARHHREHVEGDYRNPPDPEEHAAPRAYSMAHMDTPVFLSSEARNTACQELVASLEHQQVEVIACAVDDHHFHILARFVLPEKPSCSKPWAAGTHNQPIYACIRHIVGLAKSRAARAISSQGLAPAGGVWGKRFKITPITDRAHQLNVFSYITEHGDRGASLWTFKDQRIDPSTARRTR